MTPNIIERLLKTIEPQLTEMVNRITNYIEEKEKRVVTTQEKTYISLSTVYKLSEALSKYLKNDDIIITANSTLDHGSNAVINTVIKRDNIDHTLTTEVIYAGGYNIQSLHYRYITHTDLKQEGDSLLSTPYKEKLKILKSTEKIEKDIKMYENYIKTDEENIEKLSQMTRQEIFDDHTYKRPTWAEIIERGADKNFNYSEETYNRVQDEYEEYMIKWHTQAIERSKDRIKEFRLKIKKLEKKLSSQ